MNKEEVIQLHKTEVICNKCAIRELLKLNKEYSLAEIMSILGVDKDIYDIVRHIYRKEKKGEYWKKGE